MTDENHDLMVVTEPDSNGEYRAVIRLDGRRLLSLNEGGAMRYAMTVMRAAQRAEYDAAVFAQTKMLTDEETAGRMLKDLRDQRPAPGAATGPLHFEPGVSLFTQEPFIAASINNKKAWQWTPDDARQHAMYVLDAAIAASLDETYYHVLTQVVGIEHDTAVNSIHNLQKHRQDPS